MALASLAIASSPFLLGCFCGADSFEPYASVSGAATLDATVATTIAVRISAPPLGASALQDPVLLTIGTRDCAVGELSAQVRLLDASSAPVGTVIGLSQDGTADFGPTTDVTCPSESIGFLIPTSLLICDEVTCSVDLDIELTSPEPEGDRAFDIALARARPGACQRSREDASVVVL